MSILDKMKDLVGIEDFEEDDFVEEEVKAVEPKPEKKTPPRTFEQKKSEIRESSKVVDMTKGNANMASAQAFKLIVIEPKSFEESSALVDNLKGNKPIIVNLENLDGDLAKKIFDFLNGATYALNGNVQKVANNIFIFAPENVDINSGLDHKTYSYLKR